MPSSPSKPVDPIHLCTFTHKGGAGKTTSSYNVAAQLVKHGFRVLLVDGDDQCNLSSSYLKQFMRTKYPYLSEDDLQTMTRKVGSFLFSADKSGYLMSDDFTIKIHKDITTEEALDAAMRHIDPSKNFIIHRYNPSPETDPSDERQEAGEGRKRKKRKIRKISTAWFLAGKNSKGEIEKGIKIENLFASSEDDSSSESEDSGDEQSESDESGLSQAILKRIKKCNRVDGEKNKELLLFAAIQLGYVDYARETFFEDIVPSQLILGKTLLELESIDDVKHTFLLNGEDGEWSLYYRSNGTTSKNIFKELSSRKNKLQGFKEFFERMQAEGKNETGQLAAKDQKELLSILRGYIALNISQACNLWITGSINKDNVHDSARRLNLLSMGSGDILAESVVGAVKPTSSLSFYGLRFQAIPTDGHCLFSAVGLYLGQDAAFLRKIVAARMEANFDEFKAFRQGDDEVFRKYIESIRNGNEWGDHIEIEIIQRVTNRPIIIIRPDCNPTIPDLDNLRGEPIFVYYNGHTHYDAFVLEEGSDASKILDNIQADLAKKKLLTYQPVTDADDGLTSDDYSQGEGELLLMPGSRNLLLQVGRLMTFGVHGIRSGDMGNKVHVSRIFGLNEMLRYAAECARADFIVTDLSPSSSDLNSVLLMPSDLFLTVVTPEEYSDDAVRSLAKIVERWYHDFETLYEEEDDNGTGCRLIKSPPKCLGYFLQKMEMTSGQLQRKSAREIAEDIWTAFKKDLIPALDAANMKYEHMVFNQEDPSRHCTKGIRTFKQGERDLQRQGTPFVWSELSRRILRQGFASVFHDTIGQVILHDSRVRPSLRERFKKFSDDMIKKHEHFVQDAVLSISEYYVDLYDKRDKRDFSYLKNQFYRLDYVDVLFGLELLRLKSQLFPRESSRRDYEWLKYKGQNERVFVSDPIRFDDMKVSIHQELEGLREKWGEQANKLELLIVPVFTESGQWMCFRVRLSFTSKNVSILIDDPRGGFYGIKQPRVARKDSTILDLNRSKVGACINIILKALESYMRLVEGNKHLQLASKELLCKQLDQQGYRKNDFSDGVIVLSNILDYLKQNKEGRYYSNRAYDKTALAYEIKKVHHDFSIDKVKEVRVEVQPVSELYTIGAYDQKAVDSSSVGAKYPMISPDVHAARKKLADHVEKQKAVYSVFEGFHPDIRSANAKYVSIYLEYLKEQFGWIEDDAVGQCLQAYEEGLKSTPYFASVFISKILYESTKRKTTPYKKGDKFALDYIANVVNQYIGSEPRLTSSGRKNRSNSTTSDHGRTSRSLFNQPDGSRSLYAWYTDKDVNTVFRARLTRSGFNGYRAGKTYLLKGENQDQTFGVVAYRRVKGPRRAINKRYKKHFHVCVTPAVLYSDFTYFLDETKQAESPVIRCLTHLLDNHLVGLCHVEDQSAARQQLCLNLAPLDVDDEIIQLVFDKLLEAQFSDDVLREYIANQNGDRVSAIDELLLAFSKNGSRQYGKLLFPVSEDNIHWHLAEIGVSFDGNNNFEIQAYLHNPYGKGKLSDGRSTQLHDLLKQKVEKHFAGAALAYDNNESAYGRRQRTNDNNSCGVIVCSDLIKRIKDRGLDVLAQHSYGAAELRTEQFEWVRDTQDGNAVLSAVEKADFLSRHQSVYDGIKTKEGKKHAGDNSPASARPKKQRKTRSAIDERDEDLSDSSNDESYSPGRKVAVSAGASSAPQTRLRSSALFSPGIFGGQQRANRSQSLGGTPSPQA